MLKISTLILLVVVTLSQNPYLRLIHNTDPEAACLDGSAPYLYYHEGGDRNNFLVHFWGDGLCQGLTLDETLYNCYNRSLTGQGSSKFAPQMLKPEGLLSTDPSESSFANWTKIIVGYCDGSFFQGYRQNPVPYRNSKLYFRGAVNTRSHFQWILKKYPSFQNAQQVVISGSGAGGVASFIWSPYVRTLVSNASNVVTIADSSIYLSFKTYSPQTDAWDMTMSNLFKLANGDEKTPLDLCNLKYKNDQYKCLYLQYAFTSFESRTMLINSEYDSWAIQNILNIDCLTPGQSEYTLAKCSEQELAYIEAYRKKMQDTMGLYTMNSKNSAWTIACSQHLYSINRRYFSSETERVPVSTGLNIKQAIDAFVFEKQKLVAMQGKPWPSNSACAY